MWRVALSIVALWWLAAMLPAAEPETDMSAVVKIFAVKNAPNYLLPWQNLPQSQGTGSGCVIGGNRILTSAHVVADQSFILVRRQGDPKKYQARALAFGHDCDLALLTIDDPAFFVGITPIELAEALPALQDPVMVLGYPLGGDNISITKGVVSRVEPTAYTHSGRTLLAVQIDAAINPGNSGGPVVKDGKLVGVAFQGMRAGENMGYMVPPTLIEHFLTDLKDNRYDGFPNIGIRIAAMENADLRRWAGMSNDQSGVLITMVPELVAEKKLLQQNDVILSIDGINIANDGTVVFRNQEVISFAYLIWQRQVGESCRFQVLRKGQVVDLEYPLDNPKQIIPARAFGELPSYYIFGGLIFVPLTQNYLDSLGQNVPRNLLYFADKATVTHERDEIVLLSQVLVDDVNVGYQLGSVAVESVNDVPVRNLKHLVELLASEAEPFVLLRLESDITVVLDRKRAREATPTILGRYRIPADRSRNL
jgi:S1-C subfamily serine protease